MCGITGIVNRDGAPVSGSILEQMTDKIAHRGPDGRGTVIFGQAGLGHRRLSVIDSSNLSAQPMVRGEGRQALSFSGELYNHLD